MAINTADPRSPGWWIERLAGKLRNRQRRLNVLNNYYTGDPPLPEGAENAKAAYAAFQKKARTNFAELIVEALRERMAPSGFRTSVEGDENGDKVAWDLYQQAGLVVEMADIIESMLAMGDSYAIVGLDADNQLLVTGEDPRQVVTAHDPRQQRKVTAALKLFHDDVEQMDFAYLYLPGRVYVAGKERATRLSRGPVRPAFSARTWNWLDDFGGAEGKALPGNAMPVVRFRNKRGAGEFETHLDLLDRINHMLLQRMVIATMQAFRQRAVKGDLPDKDEDGNDIDYDEMFEADPGALWKIPASVDMWESGMVDLSPILNSVKDDVLHLSAVTRTPLHVFTPDAVSQSAEGASLQREGIVFKAVDRMARVSVGTNQIMHLAFLFTGDTERAKPGTVQTLWTPPERYSLAERASAASQAVSAGVPWRTRMADIMQFPPDQVERMKSERADDLLLAAQVTATSADTAATDGG